MSERRHGVTAYIIGSVELWHPSDLPRAVSVFDLNSAVPVYHDPEGVRGREEVPDGQAWRSRTRCGLIRAQLQERCFDSCFETYETLVRSTHAVRFARPCRRCWPELRGVEAEGEAEGSS